MISLETVSSLDRSSYGPRRRSDACSEIVARQRKPGEQAADRERHRAKNIEGGNTQFAAFVKQCRVERERREGGVATEDAGGEEQLPVLRSAATEGEIARQHTHNERAGNVLEHGVIRKRGAQQPRRSEIDAVPERRAEAATQKDNQESHRLLPFLLLFRGNKKAAPGGFGTDSHRQHVAVGVISLASARCDTLAVTRLLDRRF